MTNRSLVLLFVCCVTAVTLAWADELSTDQAERELQRTLTPPTISYEGTMTVTHWYGTHTRTEDVRVRFSPPSNYRWEFLRPDGSVRRVVISDGENEVVHFVDHGRSLKGGAVKHVPRQMPADKEWALLRENYRIEGNDVSNVANRPAWLIRVIPSSEGKLRQELTIDKQTGVVLENRRYRPHGSYVIRSRFQHFVVATVFPDDTFVLADSLPTIEDHQFAPDFLSRESWAKATGRTTKLPNSLPYGFVLESVDYFTVDGKNVDHFRYTDGLCSVSVFQTHHPIKTSAIRQQCEQGNLVPYSSGKNHYMLMGDTSVELLKEMTQSIP